MSTNDNYDLSPDKRTLRSLRSDVTPIAAVKELVDNVIDNWRRLGEKGTNVTIDIDIDFENDTFRIEDDSGGLDEENVKKIFALGGSTKEEIEYSIGSYGMGAKKAIVRLGSSAEIKSRSREADHGFGFEITEEWLHSPGWNVEKLVYDDLQKGTTVIAIGDLRIEFKKENEDGEKTDESSGFESPEAFIDKLRGELAETYDEFLSGRAGPKDGELTIKVNGQSIDSPDGIGWSFTPYDGFHPRHFKEYQISPENLPYRDEPVKVDVIAGIMPTGEVDKSGTDVIIQNRRILTANKDEMGGWGTHLKNHNDNLARVKFILKIYAENNPEDLPWDTQKGRVEINNNIAEEAFNFLKRAGEKYAEARYEQFPTPFSAPYDGENEVLSQSTPEKLDYSSKTRVVDKPDSDFSQSGQVSELVDFHTKIGIYAPNLLSTIYRPAYKSAMKSKDSIDIEDDLWKIPESAHEYSETRLHLWVEIVKETARRHSEGGRRIAFEDAHPWWEPYYIDIVENSSGAIDELETSATISEVHNRVEARKESGDVPEPIIESKNLRAEEPWTIEETDGDDASEEEPDSETTENNSEDEEDEVTTGVEVDAKEEDVEKEGDDTENDQLDGGNTQELDSGDEEGDQEEGEEENNTPDFGGSSELDVRDGSTHTKNILLPVPQSSYEVICEELGVDETEATPKEVGREIIKQNIDILSYMDPNYKGEAE